jgi:hypothetical protein
MSFNGRAASSTRRFDVAQKKEPYTRGSLNVTPPKGVEWSVTFDETQSAF